MFPYTEGIYIRVIDLYCVQPPNPQTLLRAALQSRFFVIVEEHYSAGGIGENSPECSIRNIETVLRPIRAHKTHEWQTAKIFEV